MITFDELSEFMKKATYEELLVISKLADFECYMRATISSLKNRYEGQSPDNHAPQKVRGN